MDDESSIQERLYPWATCFGCGQANPKGLHLRSYRRGEVAEAEFLPWPEHDNGLGFICGGIIATVLDCHSGAIVFDEAARRGWEAEEGVPYPFVTAGLDVRYLRPAPLAEPSSLRAVVTSADESVMMVDVELLHGGKVRAEGSALWKRWRAR